MNLLEWAFWSGVLALGYIYVGYGILLWVINSIRGSRPGPVSKDFTPTAAVIIAAYNEETVIEDKLTNCLALDYPQNALEFIFVTDGSTDSTPERLRNHEGITVLHDPVRRGKTAAMKRALEHTQAEILVFTDANTMLNKEALRHLIAPFQDKSVGSVAGEKRVSNVNLGASSAGEGFYWRYESALKKLDSDVYSVVGAAGELFAVRSELFPEIENDTILDDFVITLRVAEQGYRTAYAPDAFATETGSSNLKEELKRKVRICAGGFQAIGRLKGLLNPFRHGWLTFQYVSHRAARWAVAPPVLLLLLIYKLLFLSQLLFYVLSLVGWRTRNQPNPSRILLLPMYFTLMHYSAILGFFRFVRRSQSVVWERAERA